MKFLTIIITALALIGCDVTPTEYACVDGKLWRKEGNILHPVYDWQDKD